MLSVILGGKYIVEIFTVCLTDTYSNLDFSWNDKTNLCKYEDYIAVWNDKLCICMVEWKNQTRQPLFSLTVFDYSYKTFKAVNRCTTFDTLWILNIWLVLIELWSHRRLDCELNQLTWIEIRTDIYGILDPLFGITWGCTLMPSLRIHLVCKSQEQCNIFFIWCYLEATISQFHNCTIICLIRSD